MIGLLPLAVQGLRTRPVRTVLTCLSLFLGVLALIGVQTSSAVAARAVVAQAELAGGRAVTMRSELPAGRHTGELAAVAADAAGSAVPASAVVVVSRGQGALVRGGDASPVSVVAMTGDLRRVRPFLVRSGSWLFPQPDETLAPTVVVNTALAAGMDPVEPGVLALSPGAPAVQVRVLGSVDDGEDEATAYVRYGDVERWAPSFAEDGSTEVFLTTGEDVVDQDTALVQRTFAQVGLGDVRMQRADQVDALRDSIAAVQRTFLFLAAVALAVGALGVLNVGLATLRERVEEFALRRATGARRWQIAGVVVAEAMIAGVLASAAAILAGLATFPVVLHALFPDLTQGAPLSFPWETALLAAATSLSAAHVGGLVPAARAATIPIATVMRA